MASSTMPSYEHVKLPPVATLIPEWKSNHMPGKVCDEISYPFPYTNGCWESVRWNSLWATMWVYWREKEQLYNDSRDNIQALSWKSLMCECEDIDHMRSWITSENLWFAAGISNGRSFIIILEYSFPCVKIFC